MKAYIGIDPGKKGGVGLLVEHDDDTISYKTWDSPLESGTRAELIRTILGEAPAIRAAAVEKVHAMPKQGVKSMFTFGVDFGSWLGILAALKIPFVTPAPHVWRKAVVDTTLLGEGKTGTFAMAKRLFPDAPLLGPRGRILDGRAEGLLLAEFARVKCTF